MVVPKKIYRRGLAEKLEKIHIDHLSDRRYPKTRKKIAKDREEDLDISKDLREAVLKKKELLDKEIGKAEKIDAIMNLARSSVGTASPEKNFVMKVPSDLRERSWQVFRETKRKEFSKKVPFEKMRSALNSLTLAFIGEEKIGIKDLKILKRINHPLLRGAVQDMIEKPMEKNLKNANLVAALGPLILEEIYGHHSVVFEKFRKRYRRERLEDACKRVLEYAVKGGVWPGKEANRLKRLKYKGLDRLLSYFEVKVRPITMKDFENLVKTEKQILSTTHDRRKQEELKRLFKGFRYALMGSLPLKETPGQTNANSFIRRLRELKSPVIDDLLERTNKEAYTHENYIVLRRMLTILPDRVYNP